MTDKKADEKTPDIEWALLLVKTNEGIALQNLEDQPGPESIDDFYKELVVLIRNLEHDHQAAVHTAKMVETMKQLQGIQKSGLITPPGVKS